MPPVGHRCKYPCQWKSRTCIQAELLNVCCSREFLRDELSVDLVQVNETVRPSAFWPQVNKVLRNHNIKPHWMFALDNIIRKAVQTAITILVPGNAVSVWNTLRLNALRTELSSWGTCLVARCWMKGADVSWFNQDNSNVQKYWWVFYNNMSGNKCKDD